MSNSGSLLYVACC